MALLRTPTTSATPTPSVPATAFADRPAIKMLNLRHNWTEADLAQWINPIVRGWMQYYGAFNKSELYPLLERINAYLMRWMRKKFQRLRGSRRARTAWNQAVERRPRFFAHWAWCTHAPRVW
jgi:hypothetical protein